MKILAGLTALLLSTVMLASCGSSAGSSSEGPSQGAQVTAVAPPPDIAEYPDSDSSERVPWPYEDGELLSGTADPGFAEGDPGEVSVIMVGPRTGSKLLFVYRNNTDDYIAEMEWTATVRSGGQLVATGGSQGDMPAHVEPGAIGTSYIYIPSSVEIPSDAEYSFDVEYDEASMASYHRAPLVITEMNHLGDTFVGEATNRSGVPIDGSYTVSVFCFDDDELLFEAGRGSGANDKELADGESVPFLVELYGRECPTYLASVAGYYK
ncbi:hypothetical protein [Dietzia sp. IN118]|uniref:hypothetical protein n=1 Tax=Dietzia sp. IN118 TaxID=3061631 RepID=UPI002939E41E|nr:hypothetical protein [Dietzia sp. IN118]MDV3354438.1 hypothetical protein [Dietzia sp. IN118]